jgi:hypothetical protein
MLDTQVVTETTSTTKGPDMTSTNRIIPRRVSHCLAAAIFTIGATFGSAAVASAEWDVDAYDKCVANIGSNTVLGGGPDSVHECCVASGGTPTPLFDPAHACVAPTVNDPMTGQPPTRSPEEIVTGPTKQFDTPDVIVPGAPVPGLATP